MPKSYTDQIAMLLKSCLSIGGQIEQDTSTVNVYIAGTVDTNKMAELIARGELSFVDPSLS